MSEPRWTVHYDDEGHTITQSSDPAFALLQDSFTTTPIEGLYRESCYICTDPEFAQMGLPLCYACPICGGHVAADDTVCDDCGHDCNPADYADAESYSEQGTQEYVIDMTLEEFQQKMLDSILGRSKIINKEGDTHAWVLLGVW